MKILAIDPGDKNSAYVVYEAGKILGYATLSNEALLQRMKDGEHFQADEMAIEMVASYGMAVGKNVFETCLWVGRFIERWQPKPASKVYRAEVKMHLCHSMKAKDGNIRQALIDLYPATGGGKCPQIGVQKKPGPLFGISGDVWSALAVARTFDERYSEIVENQT